MQLASFLRRRIRLLAIALPIFAIGSAINVGCNGSEDATGSTQGLYGGYGYGYGK